MDECLPIVVDDIKIHSQAEVTHVNKLNLNRKTDKTVLRQIMEKARRCRTRQVIFLTRDAGFKKDSGYSTLVKVPENLTIIILHSKNTPTKTKIGSASRAELCVLISGFLNVSA